MTLSRRRPHSPASVRPPRVGTGARRRPTGRAAAVLAAAAGLLGSGPARADDRPEAAAGVIVEVLSGAPVTARKLTSLDPAAVVAETASGPVRVPFDDVVEIDFSTEPDPPRGHGALDLAADLWGGDTIHGAYRGGDAEGLDVESPVLGRIRLPIEHLAGVRFLLPLSQAADPPDLRSRTEGDVAFLAGGDQFTATLESFGRESVRFVVPRKEPVDIPLARLAAVRLLEETSAPRALERGLRLALRDGSRVVGTEPRLAEGRIRMKSAAGLAVDCALADLVAAQVVSPAFTSLSDLEPSSVVVKPFWEPVAGDPAVLYAPRRDRSFGDRPLRSGGRLWLDGLGVFSGTTMTWDLGGRFREFRTSVGIDDGAGRLGAVVFRVIVDGKELWNSGLVRATTAGSKAGPVRAPAVPLTGAKTLTLEVLPGDADDPWPVQDEADWLGPILVRATR